MASGSILEVPYQVALALSLASATTGADYDYLLHTAAKESGFEATARAPTSSARGLFQFIEETWLKTLKEEGPRLGLAAEAEKIIRTKSGRYVVPDPKARRQLLTLRNDPHIAAMMAGAFAQRNAQFLARDIGRKPSQGELYLAHFLGPGDAAKLIRAAARRPTATAAALFPAAAKANRAIFYDQGRARTVREVYRRLIARYDRPKRGHDPHNTSGWQTLVIRLAPSDGRRRSPAAIAKQARSSGAAAGRRAATRVRLKAVLRHPATPQRAPTARRKGAHAPQLASVVATRPPLSAPPAPAPVSAALRGPIGFEESNTPTGATFANLGPTHSSP